MSHVTHDTVIDWGHQVGQMVVLPVVSGTIASGMYGDGLGLVFLLAMFMSGTFRCLDQLRQVPNGA